MPVSPILQLGEKRPDHPGHIPGKARQFGRKHRRDAERGGAVEDAALPIAGVGTKLLGGIQFRLFQPAYLFPNAGPRLLDHGGRQIAFAGEMVVDVRLADAHHAGDIGIAEAIVAPAHDEAACLAKNAVGGARPCLHPPHLLTSR